MAKGGDSPRDYRSEAERLGSRSSMESFNGEYHRGRRAPHRVERKVAARYEDTEARLASQQKLWSDQVIKQKVIDAVRMETSLHTSEIIVDVEDGLVLLTGSVDTINSKYRAAEIAKRFAGIIDVDNQLKVRVGEALDEFTRGIESVRARNMRTDS